MRIVADDPTRGLPYSIADMPSADGGSFLWEVEPLATKLTLQIFEKVAKTPTYQHISTILPLEKVDLFIEKHIRAEVFPVVRSLYVARWHSGNGSQGPNHQVIWRNHSGLGRCLQSVWPDTTIPLILGKSQTSGARVRLTAFSLQRNLSSWFNLVWGFFSPSRDSDLPNMLGPTVAVPYVQGIDSANRSDLFWFMDTQINPKRVLMIFDNLRIPELRTSVPDSVLTYLENRGINWVWLGQGKLERKDAPIWTARIDSDSLSERFKRGQRETTNPLDSWLARRLVELVHEVDYWLAFNRRFNVRVHIACESGEDRVLAQNIALQMTGGLRLGWQRSEHPIADGYQLGFKPHNVHFTWNARGASVAHNGRNQIDSAIVAGFPNDNFWRSDGRPLQLRKQLLETGADFVIALFDNGIYKDALYSKAMLQAFYTAFLEWVLEDRRLAVVNKSKRATIVDQMPEIHGLMAEAEATGRWVNMTGVHVPTPSEASWAADISVGIGISSSVMEAVAGGGRGIHCDTTVMRDHPFYQWGHEKVVFEDMVRMMVALKRYRSEPTVESELGDFSRAMDQVDPFHDGRTGERIGRYIHNLVECFEAGLSRTAALKRANEQYATAWGLDKVIPFGLN